MFCIVDRNAVREWVTVTPKKKNEADIATSLFLIFIIISDRATVICPVLLYLLP